MSGLIPLALTLLLAAGYIAAVGRLHRNGHRWPRARMACLVTGTLCVGSALLPPVSARDELFGVHVLQHLLLGMAGPALLALSAPVTLALRTAPPRPRRVLLTVLHSRLAAFFTAPAFAVTADLGGLCALYLTHLYAAAERSDLIHAIVHLHVFLAGCLLSWALIGTDPVRRRPATRERLIVLVIAAAGHDFLSKFMYARDLPYGGGSLADRHFGAELMYYGGTFIDVALAVILMTQWYQATGRALRREQRRQALSGPRLLRLPERPEAVLAALRAGTPARNRAPRSAAPLAVQREAAAGVEVTTPLARISRPSVRLLAVNRCIISVRLGNDARVRQPPGRAARVRRGPGAGLADG